MKRSSHIGLSLTTQGSIEKAIQALEDYQKSLQEKSKIFVDKLGEYGLNVLNINIGRISPFYKGEDLTTSLEKQNNGYTAIISINGKEVAFIEFGAGIIFNTEVGGSLHPKGKDLNLTIGSYNDKSSRNAESPTGWYFKDDNGEKQHTYGTPTYAPLHNTEMAIINIINIVAREVFAA